MDIHGENSFKTKTYHAAAFTIERLNVQLSTLTENEIASIKGIGKSTSEKIIEILQTGKLSLLEQYIQNTPPGILEMMQIKGIGPKKINTIWKEMGIESVGELQYACLENRLKMYKGFGEKTQKSILESLEFYRQNQGRYLYASTVETESLVRIYLQKTFGDDNVLVTGDFAKQSEIIDSLSYLVAAPKDEIQKELKETGYEPHASEEDYISYRSKTGLKINIYPVAKHQMYHTHFRLTSSPDFYESVNSRLQNKLDFETEDALFETASMKNIPAYARENSKCIDFDFTNIVTPESIKGIIHSHSDWSDGGNSIEEMAKACILNKMEYLVISDHSVSAFYANGLSVERIAEQHTYIDKLNKEFAPFKIFKSIECDILNDGRLDYTDEILSTFDLVIASVHSNLRMTEEKAMQRLLAAIENPFTTILGHPTGRLLLSRNGYPVNHKVLIDACVANHVVIELNANPNRLDIDWREIEYALEKGALISINPDAHSIEGMQDIQYGCLVAQKALLTIDKNLSSYSRAAFEDYITKRKSSR